MMTDDLKRRLTENRDDELKDASKYKEMSKIAMDNGCEELAGVLCDISHEERTHAELLSHFINKI